MAQMASRKGSVDLEKELTCSVSLGRCRCLTPRHADSLADLHRAFIQALDRAGLPPYLLRRLCQGVVQLASNCCRECPLAAGPGRRRLHLPGMSRARER